MSKYENGSLGYLQELANKYGFEYGPEFIKWARENGILPNVTIVRRESDNKWAQKKRCKDRNDYYRKKYHREDPIIERKKSKYNPMSKEFQEEAKKLGLTGNQLIQKYIQEGNLLNPINIDRKRNQKILDKSRCKNWKEYHDKCKQKLGYEDHAEYWREWSYKKGIHSPMSENKDCASYTGVHIGEDKIAKPILEMIFEHVKKMKYRNHGFEYICKNPKPEFIKNYSIFKFVCDKEYKFDIKTCHLSEYLKYDFIIGYNNTANYFLLIGLNNRYKNEEPLHIWLFKSDEIIRGRKFCTFIDFKITDKPNYIEKLYQYELKNELELFKQSYKEN